MPVQVQQRQQLPGRRHHALSEAALQLRMPHHQQAARVCGHSMPVWADMQAWALHHPPLSARHGVPSGLHPVGRCVHPAALSRHAVPAGYGVLYGPLRRATLPVHCRLSGRLDV